MSYAKGDGGYRLPAIIDPERICIQLEVPNEPEHLRAFWGALWTLTWYTSWQKDENKTAATVAAVWKDVWFKARAANVDWDACLCEDENGCIEYTPQFIQDWFPNNPYISVPDDLTPKWYVAPEINLLGVPAGTVVCDIVNSQPGEPGFPRFRMYFSGTGVVELHLHSVPLGGAAQIQLDGLLGSLRYIELNADVLSAPPDTPKPVIVEIEVEQPGQHFIDLTMIPFFNDEVTFVGFGGGIQKIVLCGFDQMIITPQFRFTAACGLEQSNDNGATWNPVPGWDTFAPECFTGPAGPAGPQGPTGPTGPIGPTGPQGEPPDPATDDRDIPPPTNVPDVCALARRLANHIVDAYTLWANDVAYALYTQGRSAQDLALSLEDFLYAGSAGFFKSVITGDEYQFNSWEFLVSNAFSLPLAGGVFWSNIVGLVNGYQALDVIQLRDAVQAARDEITCAWLDALDDDLTVLQGEYDGFKNALAARMTDTNAAGQLRAFLDLIPLGRIRQLARTANDSAFDCIDCQVESEWCVEFDFTTGPRGFGGMFNNSWGPSSWESKLTGNQSASKVRSLGFLRAFGNTIGSNSFSVVAAQLFISGGVNGDNAGNLTFSVGNRATGIVSEPPTIVTPSGWTGTRVITRIHSEPRLVNAVSVSVTVGSNGGSLGVPDPGGYISITKLRLYGVGPIPTWTETEVC